jgi:phage terminase Nu1 subunit (DNA packaging protein)
MATTPDIVKRIDISELAELVDRKPHTIRDWERSGVLPKHLRGKRDSRQRRSWDMKQVEGIIKWMHTSRRFPGAGLRGYEPTAEQITEHVHSMRNAKAAA